jgi:hypothetical protein
MDHRQAVSLAAIIRNHSKEGQLLVLELPTKAAQLTLVLQPKLIT